MSIDIPRCRRARRAVCRAPAWALTLLERRSRRILGSLVVRESVLADAVSFTPGRAMYWVMPQTTETKPPEPLDPSPGGARSVQSVGRARTPQRPNELWFAAPVYGWFHALPVGNGRLAAMTYGGTCREPIALNENSVWQRGPSDRTKPDVHRHLAEVGCCSPSAVSKGARSPPRSRSSACRTAISRSCRSARWN